MPVFGSNGQYATTSVRNTHVPAIVLGRKGSYGKVNWAPDGCFASDTTFFVDERLTLENLRWLYWTLQTLDLDQGSQEAAVPGLNRGSVYEERVYLPSRANQAAIADYLDRETARIDALIAEKERMLALLEEKRAALISRVVTRGLDPDIPFKPSALEWLDEIPAHWDVLQLRFVCSSLQIGPFGTQLHADEYVHSGVPVINPAHLKGNKITPDYGISVDEDTVERLAVHKLEVGDVVFGRRGELGRCGIVEDAQAGWLCGTGSLRVRCDKNLVDPSYVALVFNSTLAATRLTLESVGSTMDNLNTEVLGHFRIPLPPMEEQKKIIRAVETGQQKGNALRDNLQLSITLAKERRAALITAAVTDQIPLEEMTG